jgi:hypothetical protein
MSLALGNDSNNKWRDILALMVAVFLTRWVFRTEYLVHMDSINFVLGIIDYNPSLHQPHPPGYFLYILLGKALNYLTGDPGQALLIISIGASLAAVAFVYMLTYEWFGRLAAIFSGLLFLCSPFTWFYGTVALTYIVEFCLVTLVGLLCWYISNGRTRLLLPAAVVMGITVGFRQSSILFLAPLCLYALRHLEVKHWLSAILVFSVTVCAWFFPMLIASGGSDVYFTALNDLWSRVPSTGTVPAMVEKAGLFSGVLLALVHLSMMAIFFLVSFSAATPIILMRGLSLGSWAAQKRFALIWVLPGILFYTFMFLTFSNMGYMAAIFPPLYAIIGAKLARWHEQVQGRFQFKIGFVAFLILTNIIVFLYVPSYMGYQNTKEYENDIVLTREILTQTVDPANTLVVATDSFRHGFREIGYYSPTHLVVQYPEVELSSGTRVFSMHARKTTLLSKLPIEKYTKFVIFVTPAHEDIQEEFSEMFPEGSVSRVSINGYTFIEGPSSELKYLFPQMIAQ